MLTLPFDLPTGFEASLQRAYAEPPRAYHNFGHVAEVLAHYHSVPHWHDAVSVALAILFHDAVYVAGRSDNELESARLMQSTLRELPLGVPCDLERVEALILLTARHGSLQDTALDEDAAHFLDCDMAILAADHERYQCYEREIASEYAAVPPALFRAGRARFLQKLLAAPRIFLSPTFRDRCEARARENIATALRSLQG